MATGGTSHERMPMLVLVPRFLGPPGYSMLGFGDIVLPGLLLVFTRVWDLAEAATSGRIAQWWQGYFPPTAVGYGVGLVCTYAALMAELFGDQVGTLTARLSVRWRARKGTWDLECACIRHVANST